MAGAVERLMRRVQHMVGVGRTTAPVNDAGPVQTVQLQMAAGNQVDGVPVPSIFGLSSNMPVGSDVTYACVSGDSSAAVGVTTGHQASRPRDTPVGGAQLYDVAGARWRLNNDGSVQGMAPAHLTLTAPGLFTSGNAAVGTGASGSFTTPTGQIVTVRDGIIVNIF